MTGFSCCLAMHNSQGQLFLERKCIPCSTVSGSEVVTPYHHHGNCRIFFQRSCDFVKGLHARDLKKRVVVCKVSPNSHRKNPDFSRQSFSRGRNRQNQERGKTEKHENSDVLSSKNGPSPSISSNPRYQATATPGQREREIVELFRKVQAQLRGRAAAIKDERKIEASQQGQGEKGTVDSLLKLLRKHSGKSSSSSEEEHSMDRSETSNHFDEEQNSNFFGTNRIVTAKDAQKSDTATRTRPVSKFQRRSPVPRVKFQPVFSTEDGAGGSPRKVAGKKTNENVDVEKDLEPVLFDEQDETFENDLSDSSRNEDEMVEEIGELPVVENPDLGSMKLVELRDLAKSRGVKGYTKLKKMELLKLLEAM